MRISRKLFTLVLAFAIALGITLLVGRPVQAQFSLPEGLGQSNNVGPPSNVTRYGNLETIAVDSPLSLRRLFTIASPTVYDRSPAALEDRQTIEQRAQEIGARLLLLLNRPMNPETLSFDVSQLNNVKIIEARDARFTEPLVLMSVTELDAQFNGLPVDQLAERWRSILEQELLTGLENLPQNQQRVRQILLWLVLLTVFLMLLKYGLSRRQKQLRRQKQTNEVASIQSESDSLLSESAAIAPEIAPVKTRNSFLQRFLHWFSLDRQLSLLNFAQSLLFWLFIFAWFGGGLWIARISPYLIRGQFRFVEVPIDLLLTWVLTALLIRVSRWLIDRFAARWQRAERGNFISLGDAQRHRLRVSTIAGATKGLVTIGLLLLGVLWSLGSLGVPTASTVAILGLAALAISFGSRRLVEDLVNGFLILAEDQFAIGDSIDLGTVSGVVENLNLRVTQLRNSNGEMITIPNSKIGEVRNLTRDWSRVDFSIDVAYQTNPDRALAVMQKVAQGLYDDPVWHEQIVAEPKVLGIDSVSHNGMTITTWIETKPGQQWAIGREFRLRVRRALEENGIEIGAPQQIYALESPLASPHERLTEPPDKEA